VCKPEDFSFLQVNGIAGFGGLNLFSYPILREFIVDV
jgi:hypothetical protein